MGSNPSSNLTIGLDKEKCCRKNYDSYIHLITKDKESIIFLSLKSYRCFIVFPSVFKFSSESEEEKKF